MAFSGFMFLVFWMLGFKPAFSFYSFTFIKRLFSSSSLSAIRVVSSAYLRLLRFLPAVLIPACASCSPAFRMMSSAVQEGSLFSSSSPAFSVCRYFGWWSFRLVWGDTKLDVNRGRCETVQQPYLNRASGNQKQGLANQEQKVRGGTQNYLEPEGREKMWMGSC